MRVRVKNYYKLLIQVRQLHRGIEIDENHILYQYEDKLSTLPVEILRGIMYEFLSLCEVYDETSSFNK